MKINIFNALLLFGALAVSSCATQQMATNQKIEDDVYYTKAKKGDVEAPPPPTFTQDAYNDNRAAANPNDKQYYDTYGNDDNDYYYYDSYASRINRFNYYSPFNYYDDYYYGGLGYGYGGYGGLGYGYGGYGCGFGFGLGLSYGYGGFGYGGYYGYSPFGIGYGAGYPYWGIYSAYGYGGYGYGYGGYGFGYGGYAANSPRPFRGSGAPGYGAASRGTRGVSYNGAYPNVNSYPGRPVSNSYGGRTNTTNGYGGNTYNNGSADRGMRPTRSDYPGYQPQPSRTNTTNSFPSAGGGAGGGGRSTGGGGGRPGRP